MNIRDIHIPVLKERTLSLLAPALEANPAVVVDATVGMGGHAESILRRFPQVQLIGLDRDEQALTIATQRLIEFESRVRLVHAVYDEIQPVWRDTGWSRPVGILFDLGVSSLHLDAVDRGFSYAHDAPLDMRMNAKDSLTAAAILAGYDEAHLRRIFDDYGDEKLSARYARAIIAERSVRPIERSGHLVAILQAATPAALMNSGHPAKRVFQALRIEVNSELTVLERALPEAIKLLAVTGRIVVMSYQSLEDKIVKREFARGSVADVPAGMPVVPEHHLPELRLLTRGAERAEEPERHLNPRSLPARLRAAERVREAA